MSGRRLQIPDISRLPFLSSPQATISRPFSAASYRRQKSNPSSAETKQDGDAKRADDEDENTGAMVRRLTQMTEDAMLEVGPSARRNIHHAGFSEDLKRQLEERVKAASFKSEHAAAHSILDMPVSILPCVLRIRCCPTVAYTSIQTTG